MDKLKMAWILEEFFKPHDVEKFPGWENIASKLIVNGSCLVPDRGEPLWRGGVGNFMCYSDHADGVGIRRVTLELEDFMSGNWYEQRKKIFIDKKLTEKKKIEDIVMSIDRNALLAYEVGRDLETQ